MIRICAALALLSFSCIASAQIMAPATERYQQAMKERETMLAKLRSSPGVKEVDHPGVIQFIDDSKGAVVLVTKPDHPAHPTVVVRQMVVEDGKPSIKMTASSGGNEEQLKIWLDRMAATDKKMGEQKR